MKIGLAVLFVTIIVPLLTVSILRGYLEYLWARKNDEEFSGFANTTIFDILKDLKNFFSKKLIPLHEMTLHSPADVTFTPSFPDDFHQSNEAVPVHHRILLDSLPTDF